MDKEIIEEINVEWDMESYPLPCMIIKTAPKDDEVNAWMITTRWSYKYKNNERRNIT